MQLPGDIQVRVRARREEAGLGPQELARQVGITRQALHAIETGATVPGTLTALRLARVLGCAVEELFALAEGNEAILVGERPAGAGPLRVQLARVGGRLLAFALAGGALGESADGLAPPGAGRTLQVRPLGDLRRAERTLVVAGCDPSLGLLAAHVGRPEPGARMLWRPHSSLEALRAVSRGEAHAAGIHLWESGQGVSNLPFVEREWPGRPARLYTLWSWEQGLITAPGNPLELRGAADLLRPGLRLVNREAGAGSRLLLDAWLDAVPVSHRDRRALVGYQDEASTPLDAAGRVARGLADVAPGPRSAAQALGLDFVPVQVERFDLVVPAEHDDHPGVAALLATVARPSFRAELQALGGYDPSQAGELWASTAPHGAGPG